ncbi:aspartate/glutamate racemase family protein [Nocardioides gilvus]|uniref:aspartate/glutamate racemase family protein n=1 Tax=Nocardioides gilvus TaxID=1735589 RepID=UPI000D747EE5|nr:aspartate/glutamate racemase family protein [Nocardioides gilvus]
MGTIGFLHTSPGHVARFDALVRLLPGHDAIHVVDQALLSEASESGVAAVKPDLKSRLDELWDLGADAVICTCSTLGAAAEDLAGASRTIVRVDRPMMRTAVRMGPRIVVLVALDATTEATLALIRDEAQRAGVVVLVETVAVPDAWDQFLAGKHGDYVNSIVRAGLESRSGADVLVLAQASMAEAADLLSECGVPVLASPASAVRYVSETLRG